jgi:16S rRNA (cytosine1402-N4)-methyltransferase
MTKTALHKPVMLKEVVKYLHIKPDRWYIDTTFGRGGHTQAILEKGAKVIAFDVDEEAIEYGQEAFASDIATGNLKLVKANFSHLEAEVNKFQTDQAETTQFDGILFDFGTSLDQIRASHRGFSFDQLDQPLDMRMDQALGITASDLLTVLSVKQLTELFKEYGGEVQAKKIAQAIDQHRGKNRENKIETVGQLVEIIFQNKDRTSHLHPATKVFQALRIAVNDELVSIRLALPQAINILAPKGRIITIAFHQGEDAVVKQQFKEWEKNNQGKILTKKPETPMKNEIINNPAARSAKLRVFEKQS